MKDPSGSELSLYEYEDVQVHRLFGLIPLRQRSRRLILDTGEAVDALPGSSGFRVRANGETLLPLD